MSCVNILSLLQAKNLHEDTFKKFLHHYDVNIRDTELADLIVMMQGLRPITTLQSFDYFHVGYTIPQIGKEFDLLRFGTNYIVNLELKNNSTHEKIKAQLIKNKFYLQFLGKEIKLITFVAQENKYYTINEHEDLCYYSKESVVALLNEQQVSKEKNIDHYFDPSNYLVSPFNSTDEFIFGNYFLTPQQDQISREIKKIFERKEKKIFAINGKSGTGKTLLAYDIAKKFIEAQHKVLIIHCGNLNLGHERLIENLGWDIIPAKRIFTKSDLDKYQFIFIDESQRIYSNQLEYIIKFVLENEQTLIFSYDNRQFLKSNERKNNVMGKFIEKYDPKTYELQGKVRTNKEIASFIRCLINKEKKVDPQSYNNIELNFFETIADALEYIEGVKKDNYWKIINMTPSQYDVLPYDRYHQHDVDETSHSVIGQEFDNVLIIIDEFYYYNQERLSTKNYRKKPIYHPAGMLYQNMTRTRKKLNVVIINNEEILDRCLQITNSKSLPLNLSN